MKTEPSDIHVLKEWYTNLFHVERRKCCLFTHASSLFSFLVPGLTKPTFVDFPTTFRENLGLTLQSVGIPGSFADKIAAPGSSWGILKTKSRSVRGSMNDFVFFCRDYIEMNGGIDHYDNLELNYHMNRTPMGALKYAHPIQAFTDILSNFSPDF